MKRNLRLNKSILFLFFFTLSSTFSFASNIILTPDNLDEIVEEIIYRHGNEITISQNEIMLFLEQNIMGTFDASLLPPEPEVTEVDDDQIAFSWEEIANAITYTTRYLNLENGEWSSASTTIPGVNFELENHLFLFSFQTVSDEGDSRSWIIIEDKPITFADFYEDCECRNVLDARVFPILPFPQDMITYGGHYSVGAYTAYLTYMGSNGLEIANFPFRLRVINGTIDVVWIDKTGCPSVNISNNGTFIFANDSGNSSNLIKFSFGGTGMSFESLNGSVGGILHVETCYENSKQVLRQGASNASSTTNIDIAPNPSSGRFTYKLKDSVDDEAILLLKNVMGEVVQKIKRPKMVNPSIDLTAYPNGIYYLQLLSPTQNETHTMVKMD